MVNLIPFLSYVFVGIFGAVYMLYLAYKVAFVTKIGDNHTKLIHYL
ncbi:MAG: hypothetical protein N2B06_12620 [Clostridium sp.]